jgi:hypothetical protein
MSEIEHEMNVEEIVEYPAPKTRGRRPKYNTDEERREAKKIQNKRYRMKKHEELVALRRAVNKMNEEKANEEKANET